MKTRCESLPPSLRRSALALAISGSVALGANAETITVLGGCTLAAAISSANTDTRVGGCRSGNGPDTIALLNGSVHTLTTADNVANGANGLPQITSTITINGNNSTIRRSATASTTFRIFDIADSGDLTLNKVIVEGGVSAFSAVNDGGGIFNAGSLTMNNSSLIDNFAGERGGGLFNATGGTAVLTNSIIEDSDASGTGGAIFIQNGLVSIRNSTITLNRAGAGGGILVSGGGLSVLSGSQVTNNTANAGGGGISVNPGVLFTTVGESRVANNMASSGGGIENFGSLMLVLNSTIENNVAPNAGGGITNAQGTLALLSSTVSGNTSSSGGGIYNYRFTPSLPTIANVFNSTVSGNIAESVGGGILTSSLAETNLVNSTVANNEGNLGNGLFNGSTTTLRNSIVADNAGAQCSNSGFFVFTDLGKNWFEDASCNGIAQNDPRLGPLRNNGGPTKTHALLAGSGAIDGGDSTICAGSGVANKDQRGVTRPQGAQCDIGAFEYEGTATFVIPLPNQKAVIFDL